jgi:16S rRNA (guanine966-N2)-methyltransferase
VLDICAGTGNLGIESLSRGAAHAVFIDSSTDAVQLIQANLKLLGFLDKGTVLHMATSKALNSLAKSSGNVFDLVFFDPPYNLAIPAEILPVLGASVLVSETAYVVVEQSARSMLAEEYGSLQLVDRRVYGDTALFIYANGNR